MKQFAVWLGSTTVLRFESVSKRALQEAVHANLGWWIPDESIVEVGQ